MARTTNAHTDKAAALFLDRKAEVTKIIEAEVAARRKRSARLLALRREKEASEQAALKG